jgi:ribonuclease P protein component
VVAKLLVVRGRDAFAALSRHGRRAREGPLTVIHRADVTEPRVAFVVGRKVGPAVVRNRLRRRLRMLWRETPHPGGDYLIVTSPAAATLAHGELRTRLAGALARLERAA